MVASRGNEFVTQAEAIVKQQVGALVAASIMKNQLVKLHKESDFLSAEDCNTLIQYIIAALSVFVTQQEAQAARSELNRLMKTKFAP